MKSEIRIVTSNLEEHTPLRVGGSLVLRDYALLSEILAARAPILAGLFAEPVLPKSDDSFIARVTWYSKYDQRYERLDQLPLRRREEVANELAVMLGSYFKLAQDPEIRALLLAALSVGGQDSVMLAGNNPVLINWGVLPGDQVQTDAAISANFDQTLGLLSGLSYPEFEIGDAEPNKISNEAANSLEEEVLLQEPLSTVDEESAGYIGSDESFTEAVQTSSYRVNGQETISPDSFVGGSVPISEQGEEKGFAVQNEQQVYGNQFAVATAPIAKNHPRVLEAQPWLPWAIRGALVVCIIMLFWYLFWRVEGINNQPKELQKLPAYSPEVLHSSVLNGLRAERDRLRGLLEKEAGNPEIARILNNGITGPVSAIPSAPTKPPSSNSSPNAAEITVGSRLTKLARKLERSVALVLAITDGGMGTGSGFFISKDTLVTNRHVVSNAKTHGIFVTSEALGTVRRARVVAITPSSNIGSADFAVLKLDEGANAIPLEISSDIEKLSRVVTAGYPGYLTNLDAKMAALIKGDFNAAPEMVFTSGEVSVILARPRAPSVVVHTADMSPGNSGGPLVDACGRVVGINTFIGSDQESGRRGLFSLSSGDLIFWLQNRNIKFQLSTARCSDVGSQSLNGAP